MNRIFNYRNRISWVFLAGYIAFTVYSGFHYHKIDIQNAETITSQHSAKQPVNNDPVSSLFGCQFTIFYTLSYFNNADNLSSLVLPNESDTKIVLISEQHHYQASLNQENLRAPPQNS